ncbi:MAG: hypothetical protein AAFU71_09525 [Cyanobacteria bacterium J06632_22]
MTRYRLLQDSVLLGFGLCLILLTVLAMKADRLVSLTDVDAAEVSHIQ